MLLEFHVFLLVIRMVNVSHHRFALAQATVEQGKFLLAGQELEKEEKLVEKQKAEWSAVRLRKENMSAAVAERRRRLREK